MRRCGGGHLNQSLGKVDCALRLLVTAQAQRTLRGRSDSSRTEDTSRRVQACGFAPYFLSILLRISNAGTGCTSGGRKDALYLLQFHL